MSTTSALQTATAKPSISNMSTKLFRSMLATIPLGSQDHELRNECLDLLSGEPDHQLALDCDRDALRIGLTLLGDRITV